MERGGLGLRDGCPPGRVVSVDPDDYPQSDECGLPVAGVNIGKLVGVVAASSLDAPARAAIRMFIRLVRVETSYILQYYNEAMKMVAAAGADTRASPAEERRVLFETGIQVVESLALVMAMSIFSVQVTHVRTTAAELWPHSSRDPVSRSIVTYS